MNIIGKLSLICLMLVAAQGMCADNIEDLQQQLKASSSTEKVVKAIYRTLENQTFLTIYLVVDLMNKNRKDYSTLPTVYGTWVIMCELIGQLKKNFEGTPYKSNKDLTCFFYLVLDTLCYAWKERVEDVRNDYKLKYLRSF